MADGIRVMSAEERRAWGVDPFNHPSPPPPLYVEVPGVPGNAAHVTTFEVRR